MSELLAFTTPYRPAAAYYTGTGATSLVPDVFPVAINGRPYMVDMKSREFTRQFDARVRDSVDQSAEPGESAINPQGLWRRSQSSWHYGAGQQYADTADAEAFRFFSSKGINPWTKGRLSLLPDTTKAYNTTGTNLHMITAGSRLYITDGQTVKYTTDLSSFTTVTGTNASDLVSITSDGYNVFFSYADGEVDQTNAGTGAASDYIMGSHQEIGHLAYVKSRLMAAGQGADKHRIFYLDIAPGSDTNSALTPLMSHKNTAFTWVDFAAGPNYIYMGGHAGNRTTIYKTIIKADATSLDAPTVAVELPVGEIVTSMGGYLGYVFIGLEDGLRVCSADDAGNLVVGPKITTGGAVNHFIGIGQYAYFGWQNYDSTSTGIGRMDLSVLISPNQPAYASDLMATAQGAITDIHEFDNKPIFFVSAQGLYKQHATDLVGSGTIRSGIYRWGVPDAKFIPKIDIRCLPLEGSIAVGIASDGGAFTDFTSITTAGLKEKTLEGLETKVYEAELRLTLSRSAAGTKGPTVTRWMARAYAAPLRSQIFSVPLIMQHRLQIHGREYWQDVDGEMRRLRDLVENPRVITYQENAETFSVVVENVQMQVSQLVNAHQENDFEGTAIVVMRSVR